MKAVIIQYLESIINYFIQILFIRHSWVDSAGRNSLADINSGGPELDSAGSSPSVQKV